MNPEIGDLRSAGLLAAALLLTLNVDGRDPGLVAAALALVLLGIPLVTGAGIAAETRIKRLDIVVLAFVTWVVAVTVSRPLPWLATYQLTTFLLFPAGYLAMRASGDGVRSAIAAVVVLLGAAIALIGTALAAVGDEVTVYFPVRNNQAAFIGVAIMAAFGIRDWPRRMRYAWAPMLLVLGTGLAVSGSRGALVAVAVGLALVAFVGGRALVRYTTARLLALAAGFVGGILVTAGWAAKRVVEIVSASPSRFEIWLSALPLLEQKPAFGHGLGMTTVVWAPLRTLDDRSLGFYLHNDFLQFAVEAGLPAALLLVLIPVVSLAVVRRYADVDTRAIGAFGAVSVIAVHCIVDYHLQLPVMSLVFGMCVGSLAAHERPLRSFRVPVMARWLQVGVLVIVAIHALRLGVYQVAYPVPDNRRTHAYEMDMRSVAHFSEPAPRAALEARLARVEIALVAQPSADDAWVLKGALERQLGELESATVALERALEENPYSHHAWYQLALSALDAGDPAEAERMLGSAIAVRPRFFTARARLFDLLRAQGRDDEAYELMRYVLRPQTVFVAPELNYIAVEMMKMARERHDIELMERLRASRFW